MTCPNMATITTSHSRYFGALWFHWCVFVKQVYCIISVTRSKMKIDMTGVIERTFCVGWELSDYGLKCREIACKVSYVVKNFLFSVKEKLHHDPDSEIATTSLRVSLLCPVSMNCCRSAFFFFQDYRLGLLLTVNEKLPSSLALH
jgi:hypothetical protein